jgi:aromatic ring hydroxylase
MLRGNAQPALGESPYLWENIHASKHRSDVTTDTSSGGYTDKYFRAPSSTDDLGGGRGAIAASARLTYGWTVPALINPDGVNVLLQKSS